MKDFMVDEEPKVDVETAVSSGPDNEAERPRVHKAAGAFRTISEVADDLHVPQHVLRFWESKFPQVRPLKRGGGRRYYRPEDVLLLRRVADLLYTQGYTIKGVQRLLRDTVGPASLSAGERREQQPSAKNGQAALPEQTSFEESFYPEDELIAEEELRESVMIAADHSSMSTDESFDEVKFLRSLLAETLLSLEKLRQTLV